VLVLEALEHVQLIVHHALVALDILLEDNLDGHLAFGRVGLSDDAVGAGAERSTEPVLGSATAVRTRAGIGGGVAYFLS
jgi:hypothetical protein